MSDMSDTSTLGGTPPSPLADESTLMSADLDTRACADSRREDSRPAIPGYQMLDRLGGGAFGEVWSAVQASTGQKVAVKVLHGRTDEYLRYMQREVSRLGSVAEHPHVVTVLDANLSHRPPYLVTPLLASSLDRRIGEVSPAQAAEWLLQLAGALKYVHGKGVIHCDLKLANILLDDEMAVRIVDWGQAQAAGCSAVSLGTLWSMPPEQAAIPRDGTDVLPDVSWDIYALGATLYHLLTRTPPRSSKDSASSLSGGLETARFLEMYRDALVKTPLVPIRQLNPAVDCELACIIEHCLELDPQRRYQSMAEIVDDLQRRRDRLPLLARGRSLRYVLGRFLVRNALPVALTTIFVTLLAATAVVAFQRIVAARNEAVLNLAAFEHKTGLALRDHPAGLFWLVKAALHHPSVEYASTAEWQLAATARVGAIMQHSEPRLAAAWQRFVVAFNSEGSQVLTSGLDETVRLWDASNGQAVGDGFKHDRFVLDAHFSPDGSRIATTQEDGRVRVWDVKSGAVAFALDAVGCRRIAFSPDGDQLVTGGRSVRRFSVQTGQELTPGLKQSDNVTSISFSSDGRLILTAGEGTEARLWDARSGQEVRTFHSSGIVECARLSPGGRYVATGCESGKAHVWSVVDGRELHGMQFSTASPVMSVDVSDDGRLVASSTDGPARLFSGGKETTLPLAVGVTSARFSPDEKYVVTTSRDGRAHVWDATRGRLAACTLVHGGGVLTASFSPGGRAIATLGADGQGRLWDLEQIARDAQVAVDITTSTMPLAAAPHFVSRQDRRHLPLPCAFSADGRLAVASWGRTAALWDADGGRQLGVPMVHPRDVVGVRFSEDGRHLVTLCEDDRARSWRVPRGELEGDVALAGNVTAFSARGNRLAVADPNGTVQIWNTSTLRPTGAPLVCGVPVMALFISPDGGRVAVRDAGRPGQGSGWGLQVWDVETGRPLGERIAVGTDFVAWSADGQRLLTQNSGTACVWDTTSGRAISPPLGSELFSARCAFTHDGRQVILSGKDRTVRVYDAVTGQEIGEPMQHDDLVTSAEYSPDGRTIATATVDGTAHLWDTATRVPIAPSLQGRGMLHKVLFNADGNRLLAAGSQGYVVWRVPARKDVQPALMQLMAEALTGLALDAAGNVRSVKPEDLTLKRRTLDGL